MSYGGSKGRLSLIGIRTANTPILVGVDLAKLSPGARWAESIAMLVEA